MKGLVRTLPGKPSRKSRKVLEKSWNIIFVKLYEPWVGLPRHPSEINCHGCSLAIDLNMRFAGELGWEFYHKRSDTLKLYETLLKAGEKHGVIDFGTYALNSMRVEKGFRSWGQDVGISVMFRRILL